MMSARRRNAPAGKLKLALITTTIYVPRVLRLYRDLSDEVEFFIAGDRKTPHEEVRAFLRNIPNARYYSDADQERLGYRCSSVIGWNKIMRRNIALLEAIKSGADVIVTIDDDNLPIDRHYFDVFRAIFADPFSGLLVDSDSRWFDVGRLLDPPVHHRGFPYDQRQAEQILKMSPTVGAEVGVAAGLWMGDPDIDAMERITNRPTVHRMAEILRDGILVAKNCYAPFNSQNTAFRRELAPLMMVWVGVGRYDDIWASYLAQRVMRDTPYHVHFGRPLVWQERNAQNLWTNLKDEIFGMEYTPRFVQDLEQLEIGDGPIVERLRNVYGGLARQEYLPPIVHELGKAWCEDLPAVLDG
jgi:hypothetical protein